ncbi:MAG: stage II sporulation protein M [Erysipelotrichaceae bacterium]|nr:stage II sporulation protein M [Erysipelotrichaceae bacterium]
MKKFWNRETGAVMGLLIVCFLAGSVAGTIFANLAFPYRSGETEVLGIYVMEKLKEQKISSETYFCFLLEQRCRGWLFFSLAGMTVAARMAVIAGMAGMGFLAGAAGSMAVLQYGVKGMGLFLAANLPQGIVYTPSMLLLVTEIYRGNGKIWKKPGSLIREYLTVSLLCLFGVLLGIVLETFGNPWFLSWVFSKM